MKYNSLFARNIEAPSLIEDFLIATVVSILAIRFYLHLAGYPSIGGAYFHIAHMLWGGLLMLVSLMISFSFLNKNSKFLAAITGGIGFGTFIDELGKFITRDNNYFFEPTISLIYVIIILIYLFNRMLERQQNYSQSIYLINAIEALKEAVINDLDQDEKALAKKYLKKCDSKDPVVLALKSLFNHFDAISKRRLNILEKLNLRLKLFYKDLIQKSFFRKILIIFFLVQAVATIIQSAIITGVLTGHISFIKVEDFSLGSYGDVIFSTLSGLIIIFGAIRLVHSRLEGYKLFKLSVLISIFLTQLFIFYDIQFQALWGLAFNILILVALNTLIDREQKLQNLAKLNLSA